MKQNFSARGRNLRQASKGRAVLPAPARSQRMKEKARPDRPAIELCRTCGAAFWKKLWRHRIDAITAIPKNYRIISVRCPACSQKAWRLFEGEVVVTGVPSHIFGAVMRVIERVGELAQRKDPMDRILTTEASARDGYIRVTTSENQLSRMIGRKIRETFGARVTIALSKEESTMRVRVDFPSR